MSNSLLVLVMGASIFGAGFPVAARKLKWLKVPERVFFACKHFGTGVLIATAFVHVRHHQARYTYLSFYSLISTQLLPTAFFSLADPCLPDFFVVQFPPIGGVIMMASLFSLFVIELYLNEKMGGHSHGGAKGFEVSMTPEQMAKMAGMKRPQAGAPPRPPRSERNSMESYDTIAHEKNMTRSVEREVSNPFADPSQREASPSEMPPWFVVFYEQYVRQRLEMMSMITSSGLPAPKTETVVASEPMFDVEGQSVDPMVYKKMSMNITLLEGGILFHSVFVGMTVSITVEGFVVLLVAILFHQMFEGLGLGSRIAAVPYPKGSWKPWILVVAFGTTAPFGQAIGLIARNSYDPNSAFGLIIVGVFNAM